MTERFAYCVRINGGQSPEGFSDGDYDALGAEWGLWDTTDALRLLTIWGDGDARQKVFDLMDEDPVVVGWTCIGDARHLHSESPEWDRAEKEMLR